MHKKSLVFMVVFVLMACASVPQVSSSNSLVQDEYGVSSEELNLEVLRMQKKPLLDWDDEVFLAMQHNPEFGGYITDSGMMTLQMKSKYGNNSDVNTLSEVERTGNENATERSKKDILELLSTSSSAPVLTTEQGQIIPYSSIAVNVQKVKFSYNRLYLWRKLLRSAFGLGLINELGIDQPNNKLFAGVNSEQNRVKLLQYLTRVHVPVAAVSIHIENIVLSSTPSNQSRPTPPIIASSSFPVVMELRLQQDSKTHFVNLKLTAVNTSKMLSFKGGYGDCNIKYVVQQNQKQIANYPGNRTRSGLPIGCSGILYGIKLAPGARKIVLEMSLYNRYLELLRLKLGIYRFKGSWLMGGQLGTQKVTTFQLGPLNFTAK
jgi:hypothetical protein